MGPVNSRSKLARLCAYNALTQLQLRVKRNIKNNLVRLCAFNVLTEEWDGTFDVGYVAANL